VLNIVNLKKMEQTRVGNPDLHENDHPGSASEMRILDPDLAAVQLLKTKSIDYFLSLLFPIFWFNIFYQFSGNKYRETKPGVKI